MLGLVQNFVMREWVNQVLKNLINFLPLLKTLKKTPFENIVGKGENAGNQHFLLFPKCFLPIRKRISVFRLHFILSSVNAFNLSFGKGLSKALASLVTFFRTSLIKIYHISQ